MMGLLHPEPRSGAGTSRRHAAWRIVRVHAAAARIMRKQAFSLLRQRRPPTALKMTLKVESDEETWTSQASDVSHGPSRSRNPGALPSR